MLVLNVLVAVRMWLVLKMLLVAVRSSATGSGEQGPLPLRLPGFGQGLILCASSLQLRLAPATRGPAPLTPELLANSAAERGGGGGAPAGAAGAKRCMHVCVRVVPRAIVMSVRGSQVEALHSSYVDLLNLALGSLHRVACGTRL